MRRIELNLNGKAYPCSPTMGAMLRSKQETGKEINNIDTTSFTDVCTFLWCCVVSATSREKIPFNMTLMEFADCVNPEDMEEWNKSILPDSQEDQPVDEKKSL